MSDNTPPSDVPELRRDVPLRLTDSEGHEVWVVQSSVGSAPPLDSGFSIFLEELPGVLRRQWLLVVYAVCAAVGLGGTYLYFAAPVYGVGAEILVERRDSALDEFRRMNSGNAFLATQAEIIHSPTIVEPALASLSVPLFVAEEGETLDPLSKALALLSVTPVRGTDVVAINFRASQAETGSKFVEAVVREYRDFLYNIEFSAHNQALDLLTKREAELRSTLSGLKARYKQLLRESGSAGEDGSLHTLQKSVLEFHARSAAEAATRRSTFRAELSALEHALASGSSAFPRDTVDEALLEQLQEARAERRQLKAMLGSRHPDLLAVEGEVQLLEEQLASSVSGEIARLRHALATERAEESRRSRRLETELEKNSASELERFGQEELQVEIAQLSEIHDQTFRMLSEKRLAVGALDQAGVIVRVLTRPRSEPEKVWPRAELVVLPCVLIGLIGGLALALVADRRQQTGASYLEPVPRVNAVHAGEARSASAEAGTNR
ncbi:MAG: hypothetical protein JRH16_12600 [Deltaproteobacteria bacterium]|nr:hypothetical protein [Deltaproteobacteria bacterium]MBW2360808.1 hypothetical protein [Deltaproteobacteria bacterium]